MAQISIVLCLQGALRPQRSDQSSQSFTHTNRLHTWNCPFHREAHSCRNSLRIKAIVCGFGSRAVLWQIYVNSETSSTSCKYFCNWVQSQHTKCHMFQGISSILKRHAINHLSTLHRWCTRMYISYMVRAKVYHQFSSSPKIFVTFITYHMHRTGSSATFPMKLLERIEAVRPKSVLWKSLSNVIFPRKYLLSSFPVAAKNSLECETHREDYTGMSHPQRSYSRNTRLEIGLCKWSMSWHYGIYGNLGTVEKLAFSYQLWSLTGQMASLTFSLPR